MSDIVIVAIVTAIGSLANIVASRVNHAKIGQLESKVNGRLTELLNLTRTSSRAEGVKQEKDRPT